jgi:hypothetical protein
MMEFLHADITPERQLWQGIKRGHVEEAHRPKRFFTSQVQFVALPTHEISIAATSRSADFIILLNLALFFLVQLPFIAFPVSSTLW